MSDCNRRMLNLLHIDLGSGWAGGQSQSFMLVESLAQRGHSITFVCKSGGKLTNKVKSLSLPCIEIPARSRTDFSSLYRLRHIISQTNPDIVHAHDSLAFWFAGPAIKLCKSKAKLVVHKRTDHLPGGMGKLRYRLFADCSIAISKAAEKALLSAGVNKQKTVLINSSVDCRHFSPDTIYLGEDFRQKGGFSENTSLIGAVGVLAERKGHNFLLQAVQTILQEFPDARFLFAGDGAARKSLEDLAQQLGIDSYVIFLGECADVRQLLASLDVFVMPSIAEGLGVAVLEAMAMGKPVVASSVGGLLEVVEDGQSGLLVPPGDSKKLAEAILRLLYDIELRKAFGKNARERVENFFSRDVMVERTEGQYFSCLQMK